MSVRDELDAAWAEWQKATLYQKWRKANPGEAAKLDAYRAGGARPSLATATGKALVCETAAWLASAPPPPPPPPSGPSFTGWEASLRPAFSPSRTVVCTTAAQFTAAWSALQPGDLLDVRGVTFSGQVNLIDRQPSAWGAEVHFDDGCRFLGGGARLLNGAWVKNVRNVRLYGGDLSNPTGHGIRFEDFDGSWWGFNVHDVGGTCVQAFAISRDCTMDVRGEVSRNGGDLSMDPHAEKGTGLHGFYVGDSSSFTTRGTFMALAHDLPAGHAMEIGYGVDVTAEVDARRCTKVATQQVAGSALCLWGHDVKVQADYLYGEDLAGRMVEIDGLGSTAIDVKVAYARAHGTRLAPYPAHAGVTYQDVA